MKEDEVIYGDNGFFSPKDLMGKSNKSQQEFFSKSGHPHKCEEDTMGWGKAVAIRKIPL